VEEELSHFTQSSNIACGLPTNASKSIQKADFARNPGMVPGSYVDYEDGSCVWSISYNFSIYLRA
jgi:hypothetical protein